MITFCGPLVKHFAMETLRVSENDLRNHDKRLPDMALAYFKLVSIGPNTLRDNDYQPVAICDLMTKQQGHFMFGESTESMRDALHELVDTFVDKIEGKSV